MQKFSRPLLVCAAVTGLTLPLATPVMADAGDWIVRVGVTHVAPNDSSGAVNTPAGPAAGTEVEVDDGTSLGFNFTYMMTENIGVELLAALPFSHDINPNATLATITGPDTIGSTSHLPPTLSAQYHFAPNAKVRPYVGAGLNYTLFFDEEVEGGLKAAGYNDLELDNSFGLAAQFGVDFDVSSNWFVNADLRYINIETEATINEASAGSGALGDTLTVKDVKINPWVFTMAVGTKF